MPFTAFHTVVNIHGALTTKATFGREEEGGKKGGRREEEGRKKGRRREEEGRNGHRLVVPL
jgi:hypothetical protein